MKHIKLKSGEKVFIDDEDFERVSEYAWHFFGAGYIGRSQSLGYFNGKQKNKTLYLHRFLINAPDGYEVDHIDHNKLNNCKSNLRICTRSQNNMNHKKQSNNTSGYKGVSWYKPYSKFRAYAKKNGKIFYLGYYEEAKEAAKAYDKKAKELFGEYALLNFPLSVFT